MTHRRLLIAAAFPLSLSAQDTTATKASLLAADRAAAAGAAALADALAPDAALLLPGLDIRRGHAEYAPYLAAIAASAEGRAAWTPLHAVVSRDGGFGCTTGVLHLAAAESTQPSTGRYLACWARDRRGTWRMHALSRLASPARLKALPDGLAGAPGSSGVAAPRGIDAPRAMRDADRAFARFSADSGGPANAFARWIAPDGMKLDGRAVPVRGPDEIRRDFAGFPPTGQFEWAPVDDLGGASRDGSLGFTIGEARSAVSATTVTYSKYLTVWRRESDGTYRFIFDTGSYRPAPPPR